MGKIRDFIYNCSDIFTALIILALAGYLIFTRIEVIMAYPDSYTPSQTEQNEPLNPDDSLGGNVNGGVASPAGIMDDSTSGGAVAGGTDGTAPGGTASGGAVTGSTDGAASNGGVTPPDAADTITVTIPEGSTVEQVGNILYENGLVANTEDFTYAYNSMQKPGIKAGSITINSNCTMEELINAVSL